LKVAYLSDIGQTRELNEDSLYLNEDLGLFMIADGMGGHNAGEVASKLAVTLVAALIEERLDSAADLVELVQSSIARANEVILQKSLHRAGWSEMGTTLVLALLTQDRMIVAHVGDSRAYTVEHGDIRQLTQDHTFVAEWLKEGRITKEEARTHHQRHGLTEALGITDEAETEIGIWPREKNACLLLCSDGLTDMLTDEEILAAIHSSREPAEACTRLIEDANERGGADNITVILVCPE
jgi:protein phosphatase